MANVKPFSSRFQQPDDPAFEVSYDPVSHDQLRRVTLFGKNSMLVQLTPQVAIAAASAIVALASLALSVYTGWLTRRHFRHTLRPIINIDTDISPNQERYSILLHNCGPGAAVVKRWALTIAGMKPEDLGKMSSRKLTDALGYASLIDFTHYFPGDALQAGQRIEVIGTRGVAKTEEECEKFKDILKRVRIDFEYSSVYGESWTKVYDGAKENERA